MLVAWLLVPWHWLPDGRQITPVSPSDAFTHRQLVRADSYSSAQRTLSLTSYGVSLLVTFGLGFTPLGARLLGRLRGWWWVRVTLGCFLLLLIGELVTLPLALMIRRNALRAGLTNQDLAGWLRDDLVGLLVSTAFTAIGALVLIGLARRLPRVWPLCAGVLSALLVVLGSFVYPLAGRAALQQLHEPPRTGPCAPRSCGWQPWSTCGRRRAGGRRVASYDVAQRLRHRLRQHPARGPLRQHRQRPEAGARSSPSSPTSSATPATTTCCSARSSARVARPWVSALLALIVARPGVRRRSGITGMADPRAVALLLALTAAASFLASPVENTISRAIEARADLSALDATRDPDAFVELQKQLAISSLQQPTPPEWDQLWFGSHPTPVQRIGMARTLAKAYDEGAR